MYKKLEILQTWQLTATILNLGNPTDLYEVECSLNSC